MVTRTFTKGASGWLSDSHLQAKAVRCQFEWIWHKGKSPQNQPRLHKQIASCNALIARENSNYYRNLISDIAHDSKKPWEVLCSVLHSVPGKGTPLLCISYLANGCVTFFSDKISKTRDSFSSTDSFTLPAPPDEPKFDLFTSVSEDEVRKVKVPSQLNDQFTSYRLLVSQPISIVTRPKPLCCLLKMESILLLLEVKLPLLFSWTNQQRSTH